MLFLNFFRHECVFIACTLVPILITLISKAIFGKGGLVEIRRTLIFSSTGFVFSPFRQLKRNESSAQKL